MVLPAAGSSNEMQSKKHIATAGVATMSPIEEMLEEATLPAHADSGPLPEMDTSHNQQQIDVRSM